ncbi:MAG: DUF1189 family protein [Anaerolineales bacterium]|jgi:hypothetical protein
MEFHDPKTEQPSTNSHPEGWGARAVWHAASFVLPVFSLRFYRISLRKGLSQALIFFTIFATSLSALFTLKVVRIITELDAQIETALSEGAFPDIYIEDGIASVNAPQPLVLLDQQGQLIVLDTSGEYTDIDPGLYREGILLTRSELIVLDNTGQRQSLQLSDLNELFNTNPIVIDEAFLLGAWSRFSRVAAGIAGIGLWVWHFFVRMMLLALVGLLIWGTVSILRNRMDYQSIMVVGFYAVVPALYIHYLLARVGLSWPGMQTILLMLIWMGVSIATLYPTDLEMAAQEQNLLRMTPIGIPMLVVLAWDVIFTPDIEPLALWGVPILTFIAWFVMRRFQ